MTAVILLMTVPGILGYKTYAVLTDSMETTIQQGSLVIVKYTRFDDVKKDDIATFQSSMDSEKRFTHRIVEIDRQNRSFVTRGDKTGLDDPEKSDYGKMIGKVIFTVPYGGVLSAAADNFKVKIAVMFLIALWIALEIELCILRKKKRKEIKNEA